MSEQEKTIEYLAKEVGISRENAELRMLDDDLWLLEPQGRYALPPGEETVREWRDAVEFLECLYLASQAVDNRALMHTLSDAHVRAIEALRRARQRAQEVSEE